MHGVLPEFGRPKCPRSDINIGGPKLPLIIIIIIIISSIIRSHFGSRKPCLACAAGRGSTWAEVDLGAVGSFVVACTTAIVHL